MLATIRHLVLAATVVMALAGCSRLVKQAAPPGWPANWESRTLARSDHAWIYGSSPSAAEDGAAAAAAGVQLFRDAASADPPDVLVIMTDRAEDLPPLSHPVEQLIQDPNRPGNSPASAGVSDAIDADPGMTPEERTVARNAVATMIRCAAVPLGGDPRSILPTLPPAVADSGVPVVLLPTRRAIASAADRLFSDITEQSAMNAAARLLAAPVLAWAKSRLIDSLTDARRMAILEAQSNAASAAGTITPAQRRQIAGLIDQQRAAMESSLQAHP